jgi:hypothetical protein
MLFDLGSFFQSSSRIVAAAAIVNGAIFLPRLDFRVTGFFGRIFAIFLGDCSLWTVF